MAKDVFKKWLDSHKFFGGKLVKIPDVKKYVNYHPDHYKNLCEKFKKVPLNEVELFCSADVYDNKMPNRDILEDGSKIYHLIKNIDHMKFHVQLVHEPWYSRWRVHPGSGRFIAQCETNPESPIPAIYIYFNEKIFDLPDEYIDLTDMPYDEIYENLCISADHNELDFTDFPAFGKESIKRDGEWNPPNRMMNPLWYPWSFIRYSEGNNFGKYKTAWREDALEFWFLLNS
jgi:hypothetical protein